MGAGVKPAAGFIGLGLMGKSMARNILKAGYPLVVHNRSRGAVDELVAEGASAADSPLAVAQRAAIVVTMLPNGPDVRQVTAGHVEVPLPGAAQAVQLVTSLLPAGHAEENISVLVTALERLAGVTIGQGPE